MRFMIFLALFLSVLLLMSGCSDTETRLYSSMDLGTVIESNYIPAGAYGDLSVTQVRTERGNFTVYDNKVFLIGEQILLKKRDDGWGWICVVERDVCYSAGFQ